MLDEAIELARQESALIMQDDAAGLEECVEKRIGLMQNAWELRDGCNVDLLSEKLVALRDLQGTLDALAQKEHASTRDQINKRKKVSQAMGVYGNKMRRSQLPQVVMNQS